MAANASQLEHEIAQLLEELSSVQGELLDLLKRKQSLMVKGDLEGLAPIQVQEAKLCDRLQACHDRRGELLAGVASGGMQAQSLKQLADGLPGKQNEGLGEQIGDVGNRLKLLQHESLTNWVIAQRSLLHISQMLEIIATGGKIQPTYGSEELLNNRGSLVDHAA